MPRKRREHYPTGYPSVVAALFLSRNMQHIRQVIGESQAVFAERLGVTQRRVSQLEIGNGNPTLRSLEPIAERLGISVSALLKDYKGGVPLPAWTDAYKNQPPPGKRAGWIIENGKRRAWTPDDAQNTPQAVFDVD